MKTIKHYLLIILALSLLLGGTSMFTSSAAEMIPTDDILIDSEVNLVGDNELQPMITSRCYDGDEDVIYVNHSIKPDDFVSPNSTIYYISTGTSSGVVYSIIY